MNKRGQEGGLTFGTILGIIIGVIAAVLIVMGLMGFFDPLFAKFKFIPGEGVATISAACDGYVTLNSRADYCLFREITVDGVKQYANCEYQMVQDNMKAENKGKITCPTTETPATELIRQKCINLVLAAASDSIVNGEKCSNYYSKISCTTDLSGVTLVPGEKCPPSTQVKLTRTLTEGFSQAPGLICCVGAL